MELTINLPDSVFQQLRAIAELTEQPLNDLVLQSLVGNLPPSIDTAPAEVCAELLKMQTLMSVEELRRIAQAEVPENQQAERFELVNKNKSESLTEVEQVRLRELRLFGDQLMLKKNHAYAILRWRGQPIRNLDQLPLV
jgi:hypothetical protein